MPAIRRPTDYRVDPFDLRLFATVLELGTITAAAQAASLSLAAASTRLKGLEVLVGTKLLDRSKSGAVPTDAGRALARSARRVLAEVESLHVEMAAFGSGLRGTVRLLCNTAAIAEAVPPRLGRFLIRHADIDVELQEMPSDAVLDALRRGAGDVGIVADHVDTSGLVTQTWLEDRLVALVPRHMALRAARSVHFVQLLDQPFVGLSAEGGLSRFLLQQASRSGRVPRHRVRVTNFDAAAQLVAAGVGVAVMPLSAAVRWRAATVRIVPLKDAWAKRRLIICATAEASDRPGVHALLEAMIAA